MCLVMLSLIIYSFLNICLTNVVTATNENQIKIQQKCQLTRLEENIADIRKHQKDPPLHTLKQLKKLYPGEVFKKISPSTCEDIDPVICQQLAKSGMCSGEDSEQAWRQEKANPGYREQYLQRYGFHLRDPDSVKYGQIHQMQVFCRNSCQAHFLNSTEGKEPERISRLGGFHEKVIENFGLEIPNICNVAEGWTPSARARALDIMMTSHLQPRLVPKFHPVGFEKVKIPTEMYARILNNRKKRLMEAKFILESCDAGMQNCQKIIESSKLQECHVISAENYWYRSLSKAVLDEIYQKMRILAQDWIGNKIELAGTSVYGIRKYTRGAKLLAHLDHLKSHVISAILNINQKVDEDWPLQIFDNDGNIHEVFLKPGEMVWYESASLVHARAKPLNGSYFENLFVHYMPRSQAWYKEDYSVDYGDPIKFITLEHLQEAETKMLQFEEELDEKRETQRKHEEMLSFEDRMKLDVLF